MHERSASESFFNGWVDEFDDAPDVAIGHEWWAGMNIDDDSDADDYGDVADRFDAYAGDPDTEDFEGSRNGKTGGSFNSDARGPREVPGRWNAGNRAARVETWTETDAKAWTGTGDRRRVLRARGGCWRCPFRMSTRGAR